MTRNRTSVVAVVGLAAAVAAVVAVAGAQSGGSPTSRDRVLRRYALLRGPTAGGAQLAAVFGSTLPSGVPAMQARKAHLPAGQLAVWAVPGDDSACVAVAGTQGAIVGCDPYDQLASMSAITLGGGASGAGPLKPHEVVVAGIVPDGVDSVVLHLKSGEAQSLPVHDNVYTADVGSATDYASWTDASGEHRQEVPSNDG